MTEKFNYKALILARESRGLTQTTLSTLSEIPQSTISRIEKDNWVVDKDYIKKFSEVLNYPESFFYQDINLFPPNLYYRKKVLIPAKIKEMAEATMNIYRLNIQTLLQSYDLPQSSIPVVEEARHPNPIDTAIFVRQYWKVPKGRIENLTELLESKGIIIVPCDFYTEKIDGRSMITDKDNFIIFINKSLSGDRQRFTLAHEFAHLILHIYSAQSFEVDVEKEANLFASEFLMPSNEIKPQFGAQIDT